MIASERLVVFEGGVSRQGEYCYLGLFSGENKEVFAIEVHEKFSVDYLIEPKMRKYNAKLWCLAASTGERIVLWDEMVELGGKRKAIVTVGEYVLPEGK